MNITSCINHTCATIANGLICKPLISFDEKSITFCVSSVSGCVIGDST